MDDEYPTHILRYSRFDTTSSTSAKLATILGWLVRCPRACSIIPHHQSRFHKGDPRSSLKCYPVTLMDRIKQRNTGVKKKRKRHTTSSTRSSHRTTMLPTIGQQGLLPQRDHGPEKSETQQPLCSNSSTTYSLSYQRTPQRQTIPWSTNKPWTP